MFRITLCETMVIGGRTIVETRITLGATDARCLPSGEQLRTRTPPEKTISMVQNGIGFQNGFSCHFRTASGGIARPRDNRSFSWCRGRPRFPLFHVQRRILGKDNRGQISGKPPTSRTAGVSLPPDCPVSGSIFENHDRRRRPHLSSH